MDPALLNGGALNGRRAACSVSAIDWRVINSEQMFGNGCLGTMVKGIEDGQWGA